MEGRRIHLEVKEGWALGRVQGWGSLSREGRRVQVLPVGSSKTVNKNRFSLFYSFLHKLKNRFQELNKNKLKNQFQELNINKLKNRFQELNKNKLNNRFQELNINKLKNRFQ